MRSLNQRNEPSFSQTGLPLSLTHALVVSRSSLRGVPIAASARFRSSHVCSRSWTWCTTRCESGVQSTLTMRNSSVADVAIRSTQTGAPPVDARDAELHQRIRIAGLRVVGDLERRAVGNVVDDRVFGHRPFVELQEREARGVGTPPVAAEAAAAVDLFLVQPIELAVENLARCRRSSAPARAARATSTTYRLLARTNATSRPSGLNVASSSVPDAVVRRDACAGEVVEVQVVGDRDQRAGARRVEGQVAGASDESCLCRASRRAAPRAPLPCGRRRRAATSGPRRRPPSAIQIRFPTRSRPR